MSKLSLMIIFVWTFGFPLLGQSPTPSIPPTDNSLKALATPAWTPPNPPPAQDNWVWSTKDATYRNVVITGFNTDDGTVTITHSAGSICLPVSSLSADIQKILNFAATTGPNVSAVTTAPTNSPNEAAVDDHTSLFDLAGAVHLGDSEQQIVQKYGPPFKIIDPDQVKVFYHTLAYKIRKVWITIEFLNGRAASITYWKQDESDFSMGEVGVIMASQEEGQKWHGLDITSNTVKWVRDDKALAVHKESALEFSTLEYVQAENNRAPSQ